MKFRFLIVGLVMLMLSGTAMAGNGEKALMLTVFGTSTEASITFEELLPLVQKQFPDRDVVVPYTSGVIRDKLNAAITEPAKKILSPAEMLDKLKADGYKDIAVISTLLFPGVEHEKLKEAVDSFSTGNKAIAVSYTPPLLSEQSNFKPVVDALGKYMLKDGSNVIVAHGSHEGHPVEKTYTAIADLVSSTYPYAKVGSIEGVPDMEKTMEWVQGRKEADVRFIVFMFVAGDHAENDIASDEEDSLFSAVRAMGKKPSVQMVDTTGGKRIASLGLDPDYRKLLLAYYAAKVAK